MIRRVLRQVWIILEMIKFEHTVFALPFAVMSAFFAASGLPMWGTLGWILVAMVGARSCAMAFNRLVDAEIDAANPRTAMRAIPAGIVTKKAVAVFTAASAGVLVLAAYRLNPLAFALSPVALAVVMGYSFAKRFTSFVHLWLGVSLSIAPIGAWIAVRGDFAWLPMMLGLIVLLWVSGFDIIYACQDVDFDARMGIHSIPRVVGVRAALILSAALHAGMMAFLFTLPALVRAYGVSLGLPYWIGYVAVACLLVYEHAIVKPNDLSRVNTAFFTLNGAVSLMLMAVSVVDVMW